jgi:beta-glucosidase
MKVTKDTKRISFVAVVALAVFALAFNAFSGLLAPVAPVFGALSDVGPNKKYFTSYASPEDLFEASAELNLELAREGFVLMKNDGALPLAEKERKVTVLGSYADQLFYGGGGSGGQFNPGPIPEDEAFNVPMYSAKTLFDSLDAVGIKYNPMVKSVYEYVNPTGVTGGSGAGLGGSSGFEAGPYMQKLDEATADSIEFAGGNYVPSDKSVLYGVESSFKNYDDAAIVVISRSGAEGADNATHGQDYDDGTDSWENDPTVHYLELQEYEKQLIAYAKTYFSKIVVLINSPAAMELGVLEDDPAINSILWIGQPGYNGIMAVGEILTGEVNPSGRLVDFYMRDFTTDPTFYNFGNNSQANDSYTGNTSLRTSTGEAGGANVIDYVEGIYMGYRYYETVYAELAAIDQQKADEWYAEAVVYPFGYGLSYTTFEQEIKSVKVNGVDATEIALADADATVTITVTVKNTGEVAGKEVVQIYNDPSATYDPDANFEKAAANLVGFAKTPVIEAGESVDIDVEVPVKELADFDYMGSVAGDTWEGGYVLEAGSYVLSARADSHRVLDEVTLEAADTITWDEDGNAETPNNIFSQPLDDNATNVWAPYNTLAHNWTVSGEDKYLKRHQLLDEEGEVADLSFLAYLQTDENRFRSEAFNVLNAQRQDYSYEDFDNIITAEVETDYPNPWIKTNDDVAGWSQRTEPYAPFSAPIQLYDMIGVPFDDPLWVEFMNQLTWDELQASLDKTGFRSEAIPSIGKEVTIDQDGPGQLKDAYGSGQIGNRVEGDPANKVVQAYDGHGQAWVCAVVIASTWNEDLAYQQGLMVGEESIMYGLNGWYAPATNIHRSPFAGRNFEYYSQDGFQAGVIAAAVAKGCVENGMHVYVKHSFLNDQETSRGGLVTFATESSIRKIYSKPFEMAIRAGANGTMTGFNRTGLMHQLNYAISIQLYINEWGLDGYNITDWYGSGIGWTHTAMNRSYTLPLNSASKTGGNGPDGIYDAEKNMVMVPSWDPTAGGGQGARDDNNRVESPTAWWWTRMTVQKVLYTHVNLNGMSNGYRDHYLSDAYVIELGQGEEIEDGTKSVFGPYADKVKEALGEKGYALEIENVVNGLSVASDGTITGIATTAGDYTMKVKMRGVGGQHYIADSADVKVKVVSKIDIDNLTATIGEAFTANVDQSIVDPDDIEVIVGEQTMDDNGKIIGMSMSVTGLPAGLSFNSATGVISGTPESPGTYQIQARVNVTIANMYLFWGFWPIVDNINRAHTTTFTLTIGGGYNVAFVDGDDTVTVTVLEGEKAEAPEVADRYGFKFLGWAEADDATNTVVDLDEYDIDSNVTFKAVWEDLSLTHKEWEQGEDGYWYNYGVKTDKMWKGVQGETGPKGATGAQGEAGPKGEPATLGNILGIISMVIIIALGAFVAVVVLRKAKN